MTVGKARGLLLLGVLHVLFPALRCLTMPLDVKNITRNEIFFRLSDVHAKAQPQVFAKHNLTFRGPQARPDNLTLDERCQRGLPLSVRWTNYGPYAHLIRADERYGPRGVGLAGIFPHVIQRVLDECCNKGAKISTAEYVGTIKGLEKSLSAENTYDLMFPVGLQNMDMTVFRDLPVVPLVRAPRITLFIPEIGESKGKTSELFNTVGQASPILGFIFLSAVLSGVFIWVFDHITNPGEFSTRFVPGVWEGFWWAVVTMTTVGYGDRAPRSILGRLFCVVWIVIGMSIIAIFTAMITASLSASIQNRFVIHGSVMGSVDGSQEERIGTGMNADLRTFKTPTDVVAALVYQKELEVAIMDNYLLSFYHEVIKTEPVRIKLNLEQAINYGLLLAPNSTKFAECFMRFVRNNPQEIFDIIVPNLHPLKNPTDDISEELKASQGFLREDALSLILYILAGSVGVVLILGLIWEYVISNLIKKYCQCSWLTSWRSKQRGNQENHKKGFLESLVGSRLAHTRDAPDASDMQRLKTIKERSDKIRQLIREYDEFYDTWLDKLRDVTGEQHGWEDDKTGKSGKMPFIQMVTYNGN